MRVEQPFAQPADGTDLRSIRRWIADKRALLQALWTIYATLAPADGVLRTRASK